MAKSLLALAAAAAFVLGGTCAAPTKPDAVQANAQEQANRKEENVKGDGEAETKPDEGQANRKEENVKGDAEAYQEHVKVAKNGNQHENAYHDSMAEAAVKAEEEAESKTEGKTETERAAVRAKLEPELEALQDSLDATMERIRDIVELGLWKDWTNATRTGTTRFATRVGKAIVAVQESGEDGLMEPFKNKTGAAQDYILDATRFALEYHKRLVEYEKNSLLVGNEQSKRKAYHQKGLPKSISKEDLEEYHQMWAHLDKVRAERISGSDQFGLEEWQEKIDMTLNTFQQKHNDHFTESTNLRISIAKLQFHGLGEEPLWDRLKEMGEETKDLVNSAISDGENFYDLWVKLQTAEDQVDKKLESLVVAPTEKNDSTYPMNVSYRMSQQKEEVTAYQRRLEMLGANGMVSLEMNYLMNSGDDEEMMERLSESSPRPSRRQEEILMRGVIDAGKKYHAIKREQGQKQNYSRKRSFLLLTVPKPLPSLWKKQKMDDDLPEQA